MKTNIKETRMKFWLALCLLAIAGCGGGGGNSRGQAVGSGMPINPVINGGHEPAPRGA